MNINNKKLIAFDLDGTLIDSMPWYAKVASGLLERYYGLTSAQALKEYYRTSGIPFSKQLEELFPHNALNNKVAHEFEQKKGVFVQEQGFPMENAVSESLNQLQAQGFRIAISTSNTPDYLAISVSRWPVHFDAVLGYEGEQFQKVSSHIHYLAEHFNLLLAEILFVGDSLEDYLLAQQAGVDFIAILGTFTQEDFQQLNPRSKCLKSIPELVTFLQSK